MIVRNFELSLRITHLIVCLFCSPRYHYWYRVYNKEILYRMTEEIVRLKLVYTVIVKEKRFTSSLCVCYS